MIHFRHYVFYYKMVWPTAVLRPWPLIRNPTPYLQQGILVNLSLLYFFLLVLSKIAMQFTYLLCLLLIADLFLQKYKIYKGKGLYFIHWCVPRVLNNTYTTYLVNNWMKSTMICINQELFFLSDRSKPTGSLVFIVGSNILSLY